MKGRAPSVVYLARVAAAILGSIRVYMLSICIADVSRF